MKYHLEKGVLPVLPGDTVWVIGSEPAHLVRAVKVDSVLLLAHNEMTVMTDLSKVGCNAGKEIYLTAEEAEQVAVRYREEPPFRFMERAVSWMPAETWIPDGGEWYAVRVRQADGSEIRREAFYDAGNRYPEERGFYESDRRSAARVENVTAWIDPDYMDSEEWYDGKPLDFSYSPIEELDLSVPVWNRLKKHGIHLIRDIFKTDKDTLLKTVVVRRKWMEELSEKLKRAGFEAEW